MKDDLLDGINKELARYYQKNKEVLNPVTFSEIVGSIDSRMFVKVIGEYYSYIDITITKQDIKQMLTEGFGATFERLLVSDLERYDGLHDYETEIYPMWAAGEIGYITAEDLKYEVVKEANKYKSILRMLT